MSWEELIAVVRGMDAAGRQTLMSILRSLEDDSDEAYRKELARKIDDKDPANWIPWEEAKALLLPEE